MSRTTDRTKLAAQWLPADVMRDKHHERECTYSRVIHYDDGSAEVDESCICDRLRAHEQRVRMEDDDYAYVAAQAEADGRRRGWNEALDAALEAVEKVSSLLRPLGRALAAIDALREQPADQTGYNLPDAR